MFNVGSVQGYLKLNTTGWTAPMKTANASVNQLARTFAKMGAVAVGSLVLIEREFGRFDKAIRHATSVSETTNEQFALMSEMALDASVKWNKAAASTAQAFYFLGSAGLTVSEQLQAFNTTIMLSRAMGSELGQTVEGVVDIVRAFGLEFANIDNIADQLTKTIISSNQQFRTLSQALSYASSTARLTSNTLAETTAMLGVMANAGIKGSMAGTVLRRAMTNLMAPTGRMAELVYELGINIYDATGRMNPFINIMGQISDKLAVATDEYKNMVFEILFGRRAIAGQIQLFNFGSEALRKYANEIQNAGGTTERVAGKQMKAFTEALGQLWQEIRRVAIVAGGTLAPAIEKVANRVRFNLRALRDYVRVNSDAVAEALKWTAALSALLVLGAPLLMLISSFTASMIALATVLANPFIALVGILLVLRSVWKSTFEKDGELSKALDTFTGVLQAWLVNSFGVFGKALIWIGVKTVDGWNEIFDLISGMSGEATKAAAAEAAKAAGTTAGDVVKAGMDVIKPIMDSVKEELKEFASGLGGVLPESLMKALNELKALFDLLVEKELRFKGIVLPGIKMSGEYTALYRELKDYFDKELAIVQASIRGVSIWETRWTSGVRTVVNKMKSWQDVFTNVNNDMRAAWANTMSSFLNDTATMARTVENFFESMFMGILNSFNRLVAEVLANDLWYSLFGQGIVRPYGTATLFKGAVAKSPYDPSFARGLQDIKYRTMETLSPLKTNGLPLGVQKMAPDVTINVDNTGIPMNLRETGRKFDGRQLIISTVLEEVRTNPNTAAAIRGT